MPLTRVLTAITLGGVLRRILATTRPPSLQTGCSGVLITLAMDVLACSCRWIVPWAAQRPG